MENINWWKKGTSFLKAKFFGKKYDKISKRIFNIPAFLFTSFYLFFRKMFGLGIVVFLISFALMNFINIPGIFLVVNLLLGFGFNKIYMASVRKRVNKLKEKNQYMRIEDIKDMCISKGGTSVGKIFLGLIVEMILAFVIGIAMVIFGITTLFGDLFSGFNIDFDFVNTNKTNDKYEGMFIYNSSINMFSEFSIDIPGKFNENASDYSYEYSFRGDEGVFNECSFKLFVPNGYVDSEDLIYQMNDFFKDSEPTDVTKETINGKVWYNFMTTDSIGESYYYGTNKGKKVYIFEYDVQADAPEECINYKDEVLKSLRSK